MLHRNHGKMSTGLGGGGESALCAYYFLLYLPPVDVYQQA